MLDSWSIVSFRINVTTHLLM